MTANRQLQPVPLPPEQPDELLPTVILTPHIPATLEFHLLSLARQGLQLRKIIPRRRMPSVQQLLGRQPQRPHMQQNLHPRQQKPRPRRRHPSPMRPTRHIIPRQIRRRQIQQRPRLAQQNGRKRAETEASQPDGRHDESRLHHDPADAAALTVRGTAAISPPRQRVNVLVLIRKCAHLAHLTGSRNTGPPHHPIPA